MSRTHEALSRSSRLINQQFFGGAADERAISAALPRLAVRIVADARNAQTHAGQTAIVTLSSLVARSGIAVELDCPDLPLAGPQPPLRGSRLWSALVELGADLVPGCAIGAELGRKVVITIAIGDTPCAQPGSLRLSGGEWELEVAPALLPGRLWEADLPFGALAGAAAASAEAVRAALPHLANLVGTPLVVDAHRIETGTTIRLDLRNWFPGPIRTEIGNVDAVSGGAITSAALYVALRVPQIAGAIRVIERDALDLSNVNRYMLSRASLEGALKTTMLEMYETPEVQIATVPLRYEQATLGEVGALAGRVIVGVDHIPSRWLVQRNSRGWVGIGATQSLEALVSAHRPGEPCGGCLYGREPDADELVPTISFVSFWSGLLLMLELLTETAGARPSEQALMCWPFGYDGPYLLRTAVAAQVSCQVRCTASRQLAA